MKYVLMRIFEWCTEETRLAENDPSMEGDNEGIKGGEKKQKEKLPNPSTPLLST